MSLLLASMALVINSLIHLIFFKRAQASFCGIRNSKFTKFKRSLNLITIQSEIIKDITSVATKFKIPLIQNTRNGHCANMSIVNGGNNEIRLEGEKVLMIMQQNMQGNILPKSGSSLAGSAALNAAVEKFERR